MSSAAMAEEEAPKKKKERPQGEPRDVEGLRGI